MILSPTFNILLFSVTAFFSGGLAVFVFLKGRRSSVHLAFAAGMLAFAVEAVLNGLSLRASLPSEMVFWQYSKLIAACFIPVGWLLFSLGFGRISYKEIIGRWRWYLFVVLVIPFTLVSLFGRFLFKGTPFFDPPYRWSIPLGWSGYLFYLFLLLSAALIIMNLERTLRNSSGSIRWQIKFMILGLGGIFAARIYTGSQVLLFHSIDIRLETINTGTLFFGNFLIVLALLRFRLLNVEIYLSQSVLYNSITVLIIGIYLIAIGVLAKIASFLNISHFFLFEVLLTFVSLLGLTIILLSNQLRQEIKRFVGFHFKRPKYDYRSIWASFTKHTASIISIKELCGAVAKMAAETFGVACVTIWLPHESEKNMVLGGSTVFSPGSEVTEGLMKNGKVREFVKAMRSQEAPIDFERSEMDWVRELKGSDSDFIRNGRIRYGVSLFAGGEFLGVMTLDEKITKEDFSLEDLDLLKAIADQAAGSISNLNMSEHIRQVKEMEAFQTMSTFFVHDLKNLASRLSLTMQNLPVHFDNADFRRDALRAISESVSKINNMCGGLSLLRQKIVLCPVETDLNGLLTKTLYTLNGGKATITHNLNPLPKLAVDPDQMQRVVTNLLLNGIEAVDEKGEIRISTEQMDNWVVLSVTDNGRGMAREFIENSLFRPFKTTKKQGMGIGLFHSKMIVEAHKGRIEVESEEGRGTTFRVFLPLAGK
jgi:putative PEP-CTERM system histidine kinase